jgi:hypothetical protein
MCTTTKPVIAFTTENQWINCNVVNHLHTTQIPTPTIKLTYKINKGLPQQLTEEKTHMAIFVEQGI